MHTITPELLSRWQFFGVLLFPAVLMAAPVRAQDFGSITVYTSNASPSGYNWGAYDVKVADLNGDGFLDIVTAETEAGVGVLLGLAGSTFAPVTNYAVGPTIVAGAGAANVVLGDVTGDGRLDIVATTSSNWGSVGILPGLAGG